MTGWLSRLTPSSPSLCPPPRPVPSELHPRARSHMRPSALPHFHLFLALAFSHICLQCDSTASHCSAVCRIINCAPWSPAARPSHLCHSLCDTRPAGLYMHRNQQSLFRPSIFSLSSLLRSHTPTTTSRTFYTRTGHTCTQDRKLCAPSLAHSSTGPSPRWCAQSRPGVQRCAASSNSCHLPGPPAWAFVRNLRG